MRAVERRASFLGRPFALASDIHHPAMHARRRIFSLGLGADAALGGEFRR